MSEMLSSVSLSKTVVEAARYVQHSQQTSMQDTILNSQILYCSMPPGDTQPASDIASDPNVPGKTAEATKNI